MKKATNRKKGYDKGWHKRNKDALVALQALKETIKKSQKHREEQDKVLLKQIDFLIDKFNKYQKLI